MSRLWQAVLLLGAMGAVGLFSLRSGGLTATAAHPAALQSAYDWVQFGFDAEHSGNNTLETALALTNISGLHRLFQVTLPAVADGAPVLLHQASTPGGPRDLLFITTKDGRIVAADAQTGALVWGHQYTGPNYTTSSPAVDPNRQYVYNYGLDGNVHKLNLGDGTEVIGGSWPEVTTLKGSVEKGSSALSVATDKSGAAFLYVAHGGYPGDAGDYQGHLTTINLADGSQTVFNTVCSNQSVHFVITPGTLDCPAVQTAIWGRAGVVYDSDTDLIYSATGNGPFAPANHDWGDSVLALNAKGTGANGGPVDTYTPTNYQALQDSDADLGSTLPAILPTPANSRVRHLGVQGGKDALLRLLNLDNLSGQGGPGHTAGELQILGVPQGGGVLTQPAVWFNSCNSSTWVFVANGNGISGLQLVVDNSGAPSLQPVWKNSSGGTSPVVANGVLYIAASGSIRALDPVTGNIAWQDTQIGGIHWESPIVANGVLYITDESAHLTAYSLGAPASPAPAAPTSGIRLFLPIVSNSC